MNNFKIGNIFNELKNARRLDHNAFEFYRLNSIKKRAMYKDYIAGNKNPNILIDSSLEYINSGFELSFIHNCSEIFRYTDGEDIEKLQIQQLSRNLKSLFEAMEKSGIKDMLIRKHNMRCTDNDLDALVINEDQFDAEFDVATNNRSKLAMLYLKSVFWTQRYLKMFKDIQLQEIFSENFEQFENADSSDENINYLLYMSFKKYELLSAIYKEEINAKESEMPEMNICLAYKDAYKKTFDHIFPNAENDIYMDYQRVYEYKSVLDNLSNRKNILLEMLIKTQISEAQTNPLNQTINLWGMRKNEDSVSFGFEPEGYMLPAIFNYLNEYVPSQVLTTPQMRIYPFKEFQPIYISKEGDKILTPAVLVKPTPEQIKEIKLESKKKGDNQEIYKRILCQINGKPYTYEKLGTVRFESENIDRRNEIGQSRED